MQRRQDNEKKSSSVLFNVLSKLTPVNLFLGFLYLSSLEFKFANANDDFITNTYYTHHRYKEVTEPPSACITANPGCTLTVDGFFKNGNLGTFRVKQECDASDQVSYVGRASLATQLKSGLFHGNKLCNGTLFNTVKRDPIEERFRHNTDYSVKFKNENEVELSYRPLMRNPN